MKHTINILALVLLLALGVKAQTDTVRSFMLGEVWVFQAYPFANAEERKAYAGLENDIRKVYPLLKLVRDEYNRVNKEMHLYDSKKQKAYLKWYEQYARKNYMPLLASFNAEQGKLFLLLIERELGKSPYQLIKEYRNGFRALFWQGAAFSFSTNLKTRYKASEYPMIEHIMQRMNAEENYDQFILN